MHMALILQRETTALLNVAAEPGYTNMKLKKTTRQKTLTGPQEISKYLVSKDPEMSFLFDCFTLRIFLGLCAGTLDAEQIWQYFIGFQQP